MPGAHQRAVGGRQRRAGALLRALRVGQHHIEPPRQAQQGVVGGQTGLDELVQVSQGGLRWGGEEWGLLISVDKWWQW